MISISLGINDALNGYESVMSSIEKAKKDGIYTVYVGSDPFMGIGRDPLKSPDDNTSYSGGLSWKGGGYSGRDLLVPMDSRCTASPTGVNDYVFYKEGAMSWVVPYIAGLYTLACQVNPYITPEEFWKAAADTSETIYDTAGKQNQLGQLINPAKLMESIQKEK